MEGKTGQDGGNTAHYIWRNRRGPDREPRTKPDSTVQDNGASQRKTRQDNFAGKMPPTSADQNRDPYFVRACAVEMHSGIAQEPLYAEFYR